MMVTVPNSWALCISANFDRNTQGRNSMVNTPAALQLCSWLQTDHTEWVWVSRFFIADTCHLNYKLPWMFLDGEVLLVYCRHAHTPRMGFKPQNALKCSVFAYKGQYITTAESNLYSNPVSAFISWAKMREIRDFCSTLDFCSNCYRGVTVSLPPSPGACP